MTSNFLYIKIDNMTSLPEKAYDQYAKLYQEVFATAPWHEWKKCPICNTSWGKKDIKVLEDMHFEHCGSTVGDYWPERTILGNLREILLMDSSCWIAVDTRKDMVIGASLTYAIDEQQFINMFGRPKKMRSLRELLNKQGLVDYGADILVDQNYRRMGVAKALEELVDRDARNRGLKTRVMRVREKPEPSVSYVWLIKRGYKIIHRYAESDGRVVLGGPLNN